MKRALLKDTLREVRKSMGRFLSIFAIVGIGVAFFAGVKASAPDMKTTADHYFDDYNLMDLRLLSTVGFTGDDVDEIRKVKGVEGVFPTYTMDALTQINTQQLTLKVHAIDLDNDQKDNKDYINQANLVSGRMPKTSGECLVEQGKVGSHLSLNIGDTITLSSGTKDDIGKSLKTNTFKVVGLTLSPYYLSYEKGSTTIGDGIIDNFIMIPQQDFNMDYYTEINVTVKNAKAENSYDDAYFDVIDPISDKITSVSKVQRAKRKEELMNTAKAEIAKNQSELDKKRQEYDDGIALGEQQLNQAHAALIRGNDELTKQKQNLETAKVEGAAKIAEADAKLKTAQEELDNNKNLLAQSVGQIKAQIEGLQSQITTLQKQLNEDQKKLDELKKQLENPALSDAEKEALYVEINRYTSIVSNEQTTIATLTAQMEGIKEQLASKQSLILQAEAQIKTGKQELEVQKQNLEQIKETAAQQISFAEAKLKSGQIEYETNKASFDTQKASGAQELNIAQEKIDKANKNLSKQINPKWYVLDRKSHYSYMDYGSVGDRMDAIAKVFPVFFFLVAALVCLTTMTRMVDEQRSMIGTMKALGYSKGDIAFKYVTYALSASLSGGIVGSILGMLIFPYVIANAWGIMYSLPPVELSMHFDLAFIAILLASAFTTIAAFAAVYADMMETPALLMRPKAPKIGKKILLERIPMLWKHFSFSAKVTARNIFRYKKRFLMTIIGISGCTALLLAGFGIRDSISQVASKQFGEIFQYDVTIKFETNTKLSQRSAVFADLKKDKRIKNIMETADYNGIVYVLDEEKSAAIVVPDSVKEFKSFVSLRKRNGHDEVKLSDEGAIITEKLAKDCHVDVGDTIRVNNGDGVKSDVKVTGIVENYVGHYIYMSKSAFKKAFEITAENNNMIASLSKDAKKQESKLGEDMISRDEINSVSFYTGIADSFDDTISSLGFVTVVLVISAGLLAFVVLYNLTNVNISERLREIATIKVLGFYDKEVSAYVYRENILLTLIGSGVGCLLGIALHQIIMTIAELDSVMFGRNIEMISFVYSILITMLFSVIVNLVMYRKLKKIPMVESLKSVE